MATDSAGVTDKLTATPTAPATAPAAAAQPPESSARTGIIRETYYKDNLGNRLIERTPVHGELPPTRFAGLKPSEVMLPPDVQIAMGVGVRSMILEFAVPGNDPVTAFSNYDAAYTTALDKFRQKVAIEVDGIRKQIAARNAQRVATGSMPLKAAVGATPQLVPSPAVTGPAAGTIAAQPATMSGTATVTPPAAPAPKAAPTAKVPTRKPPRGLGNAGAPAPARTPGGSRRG